ncbi:hypothetical protein BRYFOR_06289 [Marvinbryantia formatexigens DSM 14469]|uniref:Uncharacterized protein n=1 Tax=Marvinbryantia formatexigens DSM 14469 TaxID=478749 RepID=C6LCE2_9FIRM|nr:hypothetical protein BRYFOR_06289 [Marvinbryantia formatexigens DSM 14469]
MNRITNKCEIQESIKASGETSRGIKRLIRRCDFNYYVEVIEYDVPIYDFSG